MVKLHLIEATTGRMVGKILSCHAPRAGDVVRSPGEEFYRVMEITWCYDEYETTHGDYDRANIALERIK